MTDLGDLVCAATDEMRRALTGAASGDWTARAGDLAWTCLDTGAHVADDLFSYASQVLAQPVDGYLPIEARLEKRAAPDTLLECVVMCGQMLRLAVKDTPMTARAWHPYGTADPDGFAAMGVVEVLVHTYDIARASACPGGRPPTSARRRWLACSPMHRAVPRQMSSCGARADRLWAVCRGCRSGAGTRRSGPDQRVPRHSDRAATGPVKRVPLLHERGDNSSKEVQPPSPGSGSSTAASDSPET